MAKSFTERERTLIRRKLLDAARMALPRTGFRRTPIEDLCREVGISKGSFYLFFETKEALWIAVLGEAEAELRHAIRAELAKDTAGRLQRVLSVIFGAAQTHPALRAMADADDLAWLTRALPKEMLEMARADDDRFFGEVWVELQRRGDATEQVDAVTFAGIAPMALALSQQRALIGTDRASQVIQLAMEGLAARLAAR